MSRILIFIHAASEVLSSPPASHFFSTVPTPAARPMIGRSFPSGPCVSLASWPALLCLASDQSDETGGASLVLGPFPERKGPRLPGRNPATQNITLKQGTGDKAVVESFVWRNEEAVHRQRLQKADGTGGGRNSSTTALFPYPASKSSLSPAPTPAAHPIIGRSFFWRTLCEPGELVRSPVFSVRSNQMRRAGRHWYWVLLPKQKDLACRGETRQHRASRGHESGEQRCDAFTCPHDLLGAHVF